MTRNNLDAVRFVAASLVLYGHSYVFLGLREPLFLSWLPLGPLGVFVFFTISGYLVSESWDRDPHLWRFFLRRGLRIFPGLAVCVVLSILVLGPLLTTQPLADYFANPHTRGYLQNIALHITYYLPGVFEHNRVPNAVNGSLWSLPVEFTMYIVVAIVGVLHGNRWVIVALAVVSAVVTVVWAQATDKMLVVYNYDLRQAFICGTYFWVGALFYKFDVKRWFSLSGTLMAAVAMLCLEPWVHELRMAAWVLLPIVVLSFGFAHSPLLERLTRTGDYSYGIYIYAFPIQQTVVYLWPKVGIVEYLAVCFAATLLCAVASWHLVERRALALKPRRPRAVAPAPLAAAAPVMPVVPTAPDA
jgi:peptidoglycan/LPS O-acetylase OafA/YrhL